MSILKGEDAQITKDQPTGLTDSDLGCRKQVKQLQYAHMHSQTPSNQSMQKIARYSLKRTPTVLSGGVMHTAPYHRFSFDLYTYES